MLMVLQRRIKRPWHFSGLATMVKNMLMYNVNVYTFFEEPDKDLLKLQENLVFEPPKSSLSLSFSIRGAYFFKKTCATPVYRHCGRVHYRFLTFSGH